MDNLTKLTMIEPELHVPNNIAIVGSSATLLEKEYGEMIDSFDFVVRFNRAPTEGFEKHVGSKTDLRVVNNHVLQNVCIKNKGFSNQPKDFVKNMKEGSLLYFGPDRLAWINRDIHVDTNIIPCYRFIYEFMNALKNSVGFKYEKNLSVGTGTIALLILSGIKPTLFGIDLENRQRDHYFETRPLKPGPSHDIVHEKLFLKNMLENEKVFHMD